METLEPILAKLPFFEGLDEKYIKLLVGCASNVRFEAGEYLFREGEEAKQFFIIRHGRVAVDINSPTQGSIVLYTHEENDVVGWSWLFPPFHWYFGARALELTRAIALDGVCLRRKCEEDPVLGYEFMKRFAHKVVFSLAETRMQLLDMYAGQIAAPSGSRTSGASR
ncbi:MAG: cyclic nucleotide-binding domain-containing protein [Anaerolineae bacterium]|nr:cyclic nucleotide-binding domain-containing protein [Anaerolineae bacterium]